MERKRKITLPGIGEKEVTEIGFRFHDGEVSAVEGLPIGLVRTYAEIAARHAKFREVDPGVWVATIAGLDGAWSEGHSVKDAADGLVDAVMGWVAVKRRVGAAIPPMEGIGPDWHPRRRVRWHR